MDTDPSKRKGNVGTIFFHPPPFYRLTPPPPPPARVDGDYPRYWARDYVRDGLRDVRVPDLREGGRNRFVGGHELGLALVRAQTKPAQRRCYCCRPPFFSTHFARAGTTCSETTDCTSRTVLHGAISCTLSRCPRLLPMP
jgi:hypothetical protein